MTPGVVVSIVSTFVAVLALVITIARGYRKETAELAARLAKLETKVDVFWRGVSFDAASLLHSPHPEFARRDALLERFMAETLTIAEARELAAILAGVLADRGTDAGQRMAASVLQRFLGEWLARTEAGG